MFTIADADIGSLKSLHALFDKSYGPNYAKLWSFSQKIVNYFWQSVDAILEDASVTETTVWCSTINSRTIIFQCFINYRDDTPTRVTRLKVEQTVSLQWCYIRNQPNSVFDYFQTYDSLTSVYQVKSCSKHGRSHNLKKKYVYKM